MRISNLAHFACAATMSAIAASPVCAADKSSGAEAAIEGIDQKELALVLTDKHCPQLVQPFTTTDNFKSLTKIGVDEHMKRGKKWLWNTGARLLSGESEEQQKQKQQQQQPAAAPATDISDSTRLRAKQLNWLPMQAEVLYGERSHATETAVLDRNSKLGAKYYPTADKVLADLLAQVGEPHDYQFKLFILKQNGRNAVARPGGYLYLDQGLVQDPANLSKAYFALAHEIAHVLQRHETQELQGMIIDSFTTADQLMEVLPKVKSDPAVILAHVKLGKEVYVRHHMDQELQSDSCAARLLSRVYPERTDLARSLNAFLEELPPVQPEVPKPEPQTDGEKLAATVHEIVGTPANRHPNSLERTRNLTAVYQEIITPAPLNGDAQQKPILSAKDSDAN